MTVRLDDGREIQLCKAHGGWTVPPDPNKNAEEQATFTMMAYKHGFTWVRFSTPIKFSAGEVVPIYF